jgi:hypothetical protein
MSQFKPFSTCELAIFYWGVVGAIVAGSLTISFWNGRRKPVSPDNEVVDASG